MYCTAGIDPDSARGEMFQRPEARPWWGRLPSPYLSWQDVKSFTLAPVPSTETRWSRECLTTQIQGKTLGEGNLKKEEIGWKWPRGVWEKRGGKGGSSGWVLRDRSSPVNGRSWVGAGVIAGTNTSPVELYGDMVFVTFIQEDSTIFICGNLVGSNLDISRTNSHPDIFH